MSSLFITPFVPALTAVGTIAPAATLTFYASGTTTLQSVYADASLVSPLSNPVVADAFGRFPNIFLGDDPYRAVLKTSAGVVLGDVDPYTSAAPFGFTRQSGNYTARIASDPLGGIYRAIPGVSTAIAAYVRDWDGVIGQPEWFGAVADDDSDAQAATNDAAILACIGLCPVSMFQNDDYYISTTLQVNVGRRELRGHIGLAKSRGEGTRIIVKSATADTMLVGTLTQPGPLNDFLPDVVLRGVTLTRNVAPSMSMAAGPDGPAGLRAKYTLNLRLDDVFCPEHAIGFYWGGCVATQAWSCRTLRSLVGTGAADWYIGHYLDGSIDFGAAGGNASLFLHQPVTNVAEPFSLSAASVKTGLAMSGAFTDTFVNEFETTFCVIGIQVAGLGDVGSFTTGIDCKIVRPKLDNSTFRGIEISGMPEGGLIEIDEPYCAMTGEDALAAIHIHDGFGQVNVFGGESLAPGSLALGGNPVGVLVETHEGVRIDGHAIRSHRRPVEMTGSSQIKLSGSIFLDGADATQAAVLMTGCTRATIAVELFGKAAGFPIGVNLAGTGNSIVDVVTTHMDPAKIAGGVDNQIVHNGTPIIALGAFGTNSLASGIKA